MQITIDIPMVKCVRCLKEVASVIEQISTTNGGEFYTSNRKPDKWISLDVRLNDEHREMLTAVPTPWNIRYYICPDCFVANEASSIVRSPVVLPQKS